MTLHRSTPAENTAAIIQRAAHGGWPPLIIPGAWEPRVGDPAIRPAYTTVVPMTSYAHSAVTCDRERLEYEREGGGAPRERRLHGGY